MQEGAGRSSNIEGPEAATRSEWRDRNETLKETRQWRDQSTLQTNSQVRDPRTSETKAAGEGPKHPIEEITLKKKEYE